MTSYIHPPITGLGQEISCPDVLQVAYSGWPYKWRAQSRVDWVKLHQMSDWRTNSSLTSTPPKTHTISDLYVTILFPNIIQGISNNAGFQGYPRSQHHNWDFQNGSLRGLVMILIITVEIIISPSSTFSLQLHVQVHSRRKHVWAMNVQLRLTNIYWNI